MELEDCVPSINEFMSAEDADNFQDTVPEADIFPMARLWALPQSLVIHHFVFESMGFRNMQKLGT
jgi:hypothetical protein